jgi:hypothetical protein
VIAFLFAAVLAAPPAPEAEVRVVEYLKAHVKPGQPVVVSELYNTVFTTPEERAVLNRLFNTFFKMPLYMAQYQKAAGKPPTLAEISEQFRFAVPGQADVMLRIMESDPRMPRFIARDATTGEITSVDVEAILAHPRFGKALERTITGSPTSSTSGSRAVLRACGPRPSSRSSTRPTRRRASKSWP